MKLNPVIYKISALSLFPGKVLNFDYASLDPEKVLRLNNFQNKNPAKSIYIYVKSSLMDSCLMSYDISFMNC